MAQLMGQAKVLQAAEEVKEGHFTPPNLTSVVMERDLVLEPVPQDFEHAP
jgi:hypothetical protein